MTFEKTMEGKNKIYLFIYLVYNVATYMPLQHHFQPLKWLTLKKLENIIFVLKQKIIQYENQKNKK